MSVPLFDSGVPLFRSEGVDPGAVKLDTAASAAPSLSGPTVNVTDGKQTYSLPTSQLALAAARGFREETAPERAVREYLRENEGLGGTGKVLLRSAVDQLGFGLGGAILGGTLDADPLEKAKHEALAKQHAAASYAGAAAGFVADLFATKGVGALKFVTAGGELARGAVLGERGAVALGEAVTANMLAQGATKAAAQSAGAGFARKLAASAAQMGTEGLLISTPKAVTEAALGDPAKAAETILAGVAGGALLGAGGSALGQGALRIGEAAGSVAGGLSRRARRIIDPITGAASDVASAATGGAKPSATWQEFASKKASEFSDEQQLRQFWLKQKYTNKLAEVKGGKDAVIDTIKKYKLEGLKPGEEFEQVFARVDAAREKIGEELGGIVEKFGPTYNVGRKKVTARLREKLVTPLEKEAVNNPEVNSAIGQLNSWLDEFEKGGRLSLKDLHDARKSIDTTTVFGPTADGAALKWNTTKKDLRSELEAIVVDSLDNVGKKAGKNIAAQYGDLKRDYQVITTIAKGVKANQGRSDANNQTGMSGMMGGVAGGIVGSSVGALLGVLGPIGGAAGALAGTAAATHWKRYGSTMSIQAISALQKRGILLTEQAMGQAARQLDRVPSIVERIAGARTAATAARASAYVAPIAETTPTRVFAEYLGRSAGTPSEQAAAVAQKIASVTSDPQRLKDHVDALAKDYADDAPNVASALRAQSTAAVRYLQSVAPPPPPFSPLGGKQKVAYSDAQLRSFARKLEAVHDPWTVLARLENGTLTKDHIEALRTVYPSLYQEVVQRSIAHATQQSTMPYTAQLRLQQLTGAPLVPSVQRVVAFQASYANGGQKPHGGGSKPFRAPPPSAIARISG